MKLTPILSQKDPISEPSIAQSKTCAAVSKQKTQRKSFINLLRKTWLFIKTTENQEERQSMPPVRKPTYLGQIYCHVMFKLSRSMSLKSSFVSINYLFLAGHNKRNLSYIVYLLWVDFKYKQCLSFICLSSFYNGRVLKSVIWVCVVL